MAKWKGVIRDRTDKFRSLKDGKTTQASAPSSQNNSRELRFKRLSNSIMNLADDEEDDLEKHSAKNQFPEREVSISSGDQTLDDDEGIDVRDRKLDDEDFTDSYQPPFWIICKDEIDENLKKVEVKFEKLKMIERKRVNEIFKKGEVDDVQCLVEEITQDIRDNEVKLKEIKNYKAVSPTDEKIKANVEIVVATKLQELTHLLRQRQRKYVAKIQEIHGGESSRIDLSDEKDLDEELDLDEIEEYRSKYRDKEIQELTDSVKDLAVLFKELSTLVIEQGTIIDRIDYNVESALDYSVKGKKHLVSARKAQESNRSRKVLVCLTVFILIFVVLLIIKKA